MSKQDNNASIIQPVAVSSATGITTTVTDIPRSKHKKHKTRDDIIEQKLDGLITLEKQRNEQIDKLLQMYLSKQAMLSLPEQSHHADV